MARIDDCRLTENATTRCDGLFSFCGPQARLLHHDRDFHVWVKIHVAIGSHTAVNGL